MSQKFINLHFTILALLALAVCSGCPKAKLPGQLRKTDQKLFEEPVRPEPVAFPRNSNRPPRREALVCGRIGSTGFSAKKDLVRVSDTKVWWESDHDKGDSEDDHIMHRAVVEPLTRLIIQVNKRGGRLKVQDAYRAKGVHMKTSLHREGRAIDLTTEKMTLEQLAKLCWSSGFDWVYYEDKGGGAHVHCSVRVVAKPQKHGPDRD